MRTSQFFKRQNFGVGSMASGWALLWGKGKYSTHERTRQWQLITPILRISHNGGEQTNGISKYHVRAEIHLHTHTMIVYAQLRAVTRNS